MKLFFLITLIIYSIHGEHTELKKRETTESIVIDVNECGTSKSCYISPEDCDRNAATCNYVLKWRYEDNVIYYELKGVTFGWISVVFSEDKNIGNDNVVVCSRDGDSNTVSVNHYYKDKRDSELKRLPYNQDGLKTRSGSYNNGLISCTFSRSKLSEASLVNSLNVGYYISVDKGSPEDLINDKLKTFQPSDRPVEFFTITRTYAPTNWLIKTHATMMIIAWIFFASLGVLLARYYKPLWPNHVMFFRNRVWFAFHQPIMFTVLLMTIIGLIFILIENNARISDKRDEYIHSILGIIVICLVVLNPIIATCRPKPESRLRCLFFWIHWLVGTIAYCLAVPTVFIGMGLSKIHLPNWCGWLLFAWVIFHIIVELILEIHYCCTFHKQESNLNEYAVRDKNLIVMKQKNPPGSRWKPTLLIIYAFITAIVVIAIVITILLRDIFA